MVGPRLHRDFGKNGEPFANNMSIGNIPLIVLTAASQPLSGQSPLPRDWQIAIEPVHQELQRELAKVSTDSKHIVALKAGHSIQLDEPELVLDAITSLVMRARAKKRNCAYATLVASVVGTVPRTLRTE